VLLRIGDAGDAAKDFKRALELSKDSGDRELWIKLARAYARDGKLRQASEALASASIPRALLGQLADDPDFRELAGHSRYGKVFER
jgi:predicted Zn-dependent protease